MLLTFDTHAGTYKSSVLNYVEGSGTVEIELPFQPDQCPVCIAQTMQDVAEFVHLNMHEFYAMIDQSKGKHLRRELGLVLEGKKSYLASDPLSLDSFFIDTDALAYEIEILTGLIGAKKGEIKDRLVLQSVLIDPVTFDLVGSFGVEGIIDPLISVIYCRD
jgi:hypothetical protein